MNRGCEQFQSFKLFLTFSNERWGINEGFKQENEMRRICSSERSLELQNGQEIGGVMKREGKPSNLQITVDSPMEV